MSHHVYKQSIVRSYKYPIVCSYERRIVGGCHWPPAGSLGVTSVEAHNEVTGKGCGGDGTGEKVGQGMTWRACCCLLDELTTVLVDALSSQLHWLW